MRVGGIRIVAAALAVSAVAAAAAGEVGAQTPESRDGFVVRVGTDTFAVERFTRGAESYEGEIEGPRIGRFRYRAELVPAGLVRRFELTAWPIGAPVDAKPAQEASVEFRGDSVIAQVGPPGGPMRTERIEAKAGALPLLSPSMGMIEHLLVRARVLGGDSVEVPLFNLSGGRTFPARVVWVRADSAVVTVAGVAFHLRVGEGGRLEGGRVPSQNLEFERVSSVGSAAQSMRPDYSAPPGAPYTAEEVRVPTSEGHVLAGTLTLPASPNGRVPAVVTITGSGGQERDESVLAGYRPFRQIADTLARRGIAVLRLDDRGVGASTGDPAAATSADFAEDVRAALRYLRTRDDIAGERLGLIGHSEGGLIAPMVAVDDSLVRAVVIMAGPSRTGREIIRYQQRYMLERDTTLDAVARDSLSALAAVQLDSAAARVPWVHWFLDYDPLPTARRLRRPVLILQGATDRQVTPDQATELAEAIRAGGGEDVTVHVFPAVNHLFLRDPSGDPTGYGSLPERSIRADILGALADWLASRLVASGAAHAGG